MLLQTQSRIMGHGYPAGHPPGAVLLLRRLALFPYSPSDTQHIEPGGIKTGKKRYECGAIWEFLVVEEAPAVARGKLQFPRSINPLRSRRQRAASRDAALQRPLTGKERKKHTHEHNAPLAAEQRQTPPHGHFMCPSLLFFFFSFTHHHPIATGGHGYPAGHPPGAVLLLRRLALFPYSPSDTQHIEPGGIKTGKNRLRTDWRLAMNAFVMACMINPL